MTNQIIVKSMLKDSDMKLSFAENGRNAVDISKDNPPDIILMDMSMPIMDGLEATEIIRLRESANNLPACPIIALTANAMKEDQIRCFAAGMDDFITKPISKAALLAAIEKWSSKGQIRRDAGSNVDRSN